MRRRALASALAAVLALLPAVPAGRPAEAAVPQIHLVRVLSGLSSPVYVTSARDGTGRLFVLEQPGVVKVLQPGAAAPTVFLDIRDKVAFGGERGLLGLAFHPQFSSSRRLFVDYTRAADGATVIAEYQASPADPDVADPAETVLLVIPQPFANHNGGMLAFGPDGYLYIGMGDGGDANDPGNRAQDLGELLGKILRIDVDQPGVPYASPADNPFGGPSGRDEIFAYGLRNPWRFSFDRATGDLLAGDVGQGAREEVDLVSSGGNYGWRVYEGNLCTANDPGQCGAAGFVPPLLDYGHSGGRCAVTGGYAYRGPGGALPAGTYVFADYCTGEIFERQGAAMGLLLDTGLLISSFGEDEAGEVYVVDLNGAVYRIAGGPASCGATLSAAGRSAGPGATQGAVLVTAPAGCAWTAASAAAWLTVTSGASGSGSGLVRYAVASNTASASARTGTLTIAGRGFTVTQAGSPLACRASISPPVARVSSGGGTGRVAVSIGAGCAWTAVSHAPWIAITAGASGTGSGAVDYAIAPGGGFRSGTISIAGRTVLVLSF